MNATVKPMTEISLPVARLAIAAATAAILLLASLHVLSPEFDPSWRLISEYANGDYGWVLAILFLSWGLGTLALAYAIRSQLKTWAGKIGLGFLIVAGLGQALSAVFDINQPLHNLTSMMGLFGLPIAAMLIGVSLTRTQPWSVAKKVLLWTANLTWVILLLMIAALIALIVTYAQAGGDPNAGATATTTLPPGVIAVVGYPNRLLVVLYCAWVMIVAWQAIRLHSRKS
jgi:hypothetical membrane protein